jgi:exonuclease III
LEAFLQIENIDILLVSEHGLKQPEIETIKYQNFNIATSFSRQLKRAGGVAIICQKYLQVEVINCESLECSFECVCVKVVLNNCNMFVASIYRSPDYSNKVEFLSRLEDFLSDITCKLKGADFIVFCGDMNIDLLQSNKDIIAYKNILSTYNLKILNDQPTRVTSHSSTLIDHVISSRYLDPEWETRNVTFSDHMATTLWLNVQGLHNNSSLLPKACLKRSFSLQNYQYFLTLLQSENWHELLAANTSQNKWSEIAEIALPLTHCINSSLEDCSFPKELKIASTFPLHKGGSKESLDNYRIIAKQSAFAKIFELCIRPQLQNHWSVNGFYSNTQHGFTTNKSTNTALFDFFTPIYNAIDKKKLCITLSLDVKKSIRFTGSFGHVKWFKENWLYRIYIKLFSIIFV